MSTARTKTMTKKVRTKAVAESDDCYDIVVEGTDSDEYSLKLLSPTPKQLEFINSPAKRKVICAGRRGGKAQPLTSKVYTPSGYKLMGDISIGDIVLTPFGNTAIVEDIFPQGIKDIYEVSFTDGTSARCTEDHLWEICEHRTDSKWKSRNRVVTTKEISKFPSLNGTSRRPSIPITQPTAFYEQDIPIDPYLLGVLIGDGTMMHESVLFSSMDSFIIEEVEKRLPEEVKVKRDRQSCDYRLSVGIGGQANPIIRALKHLGLWGKYSYQKFIPDVYKYNTIEIRMALIQGLLDTDGSVDKHGQPRFEQTSEQLSKDFAEVIQSLGGLCSIHTKMGGYKINGVRKETRLVYRQTVKFEDARKLFTLPCKKKKAKARAWDVKRYIDKIKVVGKEEAQCIRISDSRGLYLTDNLIATHNTVGMGIFAVQKFLEGKRILYAAPTIEQIGRFWSTVNNTLYQPIKDGKLYKNEAQHIIENPRTETRIKAKAQPLSAMVYTPDGKKRMGDIKVGDKVLTPFGTTTKVTGVFPQGVKDIYTIEFGDGCSTECTLDHLWEVQRFKEAHLDKDNFRVVSTQDLLTHPKVNSTNTHLGKRPYIRLAQAVSFKSKQVFLSPYLLGALIGDGKLDNHGSIMFSSVDKHILNQVESLLPKGMSIKYISGCDYRIAFGDKPIRGTNKLRSELSALGLMGKRSHEKFIPDCYKYNTKEVRLKIIQGLFDTDGSVSAMGAVSLSTTSLQLAHDVVEVIQSLGGLCTINKRQGRYKKDGVYIETKAYYKLAIFHNSSADLFSLVRKKNRCRLRALKNANINRAIRTIKYVRQEKAQCIMIADKRNLYLTDNFIVTHNTAWNADSLRGDYADILILDEFQLMNEDAWGLVGSPMMLDTNGDAVFIYTPPSLRSRSVTKAEDPRHASKMYKKAEELQKINPARWAAFKFTSYDNPFLNRQALNEISEDMTSIAYRMEILAEDIDEAPGALWTRANIEENRVLETPSHFDKIVVAIDPSASGGGDEAGVITVGKVGNHGYVLADNSVQGLPSQWAINAIDAYHKFKANYIVAEKNNGGEMIRNVLAQVDKSIKVILVHASRGKATRAEPVSATYERGRGHHCGYFHKLEDEMCMWIPDKGKSPNRMDALTWAYTELKLVTGTDWIKLVTT